MFEPSMPCKRWERLAADEIDKRTRQRTKCSMSLRWPGTLRDRFPLHFIVFKQTAVHLLHEANVEQRSSRDAMKIHS